MKKIKKPWGWYKILLKGKGYKISLLFLKPFAKTELSKFADRSRIIILPSSAEYRVIEQHQKHRLNNICNIGLYVIEVQVTNYEYKRQLKEYKYGR